MRPVGVRRQEAYLPVEVLLCHGLFREVNPRRYGGANIHSAPPIVHQLARLTRRSPGSITNKMLNLLGARPNGGKFEWELFKSLSEAPELHFQLYRTAIGAARVCGVDAVQLPDFLDCFEMQSGGLTLLGQDELEPDALSNAIEDEIASMGRSSIVSELETSRVVEHRIRLGQHRFARQVLRNCGNRCVFCGFHPAGLGRSGLLVASHIKPWSVSTDRERLDLRNGLAACPTHDAAFDSGLLTINGGLSIHRSERLRRAAEANGMVRTLFEQPNLLSVAMFPKGAESPRKKYLAYHKGKIFQAAS